jgi:CHASE3 domain sensor protein
MDTDQFLMELLKAVHSNTTAITELRRALDAQNRESEAACKNVISELTDKIEKIAKRLDAMDTWQKIRLPFIIGTISLVMYGIGFFFTLNRVADMVDKRPVVTVSAPVKP